MKGRKATPTALKQIRGTNQPCRVNHNEPVSERIVKLPNPPAWFNKTAKSIYRNKGKELINMDLLSKIDLDLFVSYCHEYAVYLETSEEISKVPTVAILDALSEIAIQRLFKRNTLAWERSTKIAVQFGFSPSSRASLKLQPKEPKDDFEKTFNL